LLDFTKDAPSTINRSVLCATVGKAFANHLSTFFIYYSCRWHLPLHYTPVGSWISYHQTNCD
jgi:hypothetical protein